MEEITKNLERAVERLKQIIEREIKEEGGREEEEEEEE